MARRRVNEVAFNFDSLTDMVTNLAGGLILIVLLLTVLNRQRNARAGGPGDIDRGVGAAAPSDEALKAALLRNALARAEQGIAGLDEQIRATTEEVERLQREADATQPPEAADPAGTAGTPSRVEFRPPMLRETEKKFSVIYVVSNLRVFFFIEKDFSDAANAEVQRFAQLAAGADAERAYGEGIRSTLPTGDFDLVLKARRVGARVELSVIAARKPGARGESIEEALARDSQFQRVLGRFQGETHYLQFAVYPDSFDSFRALRQHVLDRGFDYNWAPMSAGEPIIAGGGQGRSL